MLPDIVNKNAAYAPFFVKWDDYYDRYYFNRDIQKEDNIEEWIGRFCAQPNPADVEFVVYKSSFNDLTALRERVVAKDSEAPLPYPYGGNTFAEMLVFNHCNEVVDYLMYARKCEPYVVKSSNSWQPLSPDSISMQSLIAEGKARFGQTHSHFVKMRYAYQIVRLAHYSRRWQQTIDLFNELMPQIDRRKPSILFYWTLGHLAGALQKRGLYAEAAYRYAVIFAKCPSKRTQAFRSFILRNDADWKAAYQLCQNGNERATLYLLRAGRSRTFTVNDLRETYELDPGNPQIDLLLINNIQSLEKTLLRTPVTEKKYGVKLTPNQWKSAADELINLQKITRQIAKEGKCANPELWQTTIGYLELLAGDSYAANKSFDYSQRRLSSRDDYEAQLLRQIEVWRVLLEIIQIDPKAAYADQAGFRVRSYEVFKRYASFEPFLQDWLSAAYAANGQPGKALLSAYPTQALTYNPDMAALNDLLKAADEDNPIFLEKAMQMDTNPDHLRAYLLEIQGAYLISQGKPEAAVSTMQKITKTEQARMTRFSPFKEVLHDHINRPVSDTLLLNRLEIADKLLELEFNARAATALGKDEVAAKNYYLIGLAYYNMSYFGYAWKVGDLFRSGASWSHLSDGPVFPKPGSPAGNRENTDVSLALSYFEKALYLSPDKEFAARVAYMAARCQQKQWFCQPECKYRYQPGLRQIPVLPSDYSKYYKLLRTRYKETGFYAQAVKECKWLAYY